MKKYIAIAFTAALLGSPVHAQSMSPNSTFVSIIDPVTGQKTVRPATPAERAMVRKTMENVRPSLEGLEASLAPLKNLGADLAPLKGLSASLAGLKNLGPELAR